MILLRFPVPQQRRQDIYIYNTTSKVQRPERLLCFPYYDGSPLASRLVVLELRFTNFGSDSGHKGESCGILFGLQKQNKNKQSQKFIKMFIKVNGHLM